MATYVTTASLYVDDVDSSEDATKRVIELNAAVRSYNAEIVLADDSYDDPWEKVND